MASVFNGMSGVLANVFGAPVTITRGGRQPETVTGIFREMPVEQDMGDGRVFVTVSKTLRIPKNAIDALAVGDLVQPSGAQGRKFTVLQTYLASSPADDGFVTYVLEEDRP